MSVWVVDASPLIFLAKLERLECLSQSAESIFAPPSVLQEVEGFRNSAFSRVQVATRTWLRVKAPRDGDAVRLLMTEMGRGESEAIVLARQVEADRIVLDDLDARRYARRMGLRPVGTLGLLLAARLRGELPSLRHEIERLDRLGFRATESLIAAVLESAGELD